MTTRRKTRWKTQSLGDAAGLGRAAAFCGPPRSQCWWGGGRGAGGGPRRCGSSWCSESAALTRSSRSLSPRRRPSGSGSGSAVYCGPCERGSGRRSAPGSGRCCQTRRRCDGGGGAAESLRCRGSDVRMRPPWDLWVPGGAGCGAVAGPGSDGCGGCCSGGGPW